MNARDHHVSRRRVSKRPLQQADEQDRQQNAIAKDHTAAGREDQFAGADRQRRDDRPRAENSEPLKRVAGNQRTGDRCRHKREVALSDRKSTRLNSSHSQISYAVFCLKKKKKKKKKK